MFSFISGLTNRNTTRPSNQEQHELEKAPSQLLKDFGKVVDLAFNTKDKTETVALQELVEQFGNLASSCNRKKFTSRIEQYKNVLVGQINDLDRISRTSLGPHKKSAENALLGIRQTQYVANTYCDFTEIHLTTINEIKTLRQNKPNEYHAALQSIVIENGIKTAETVDLLTRLNPSDRPTPLNPVENFQYSTTAKSLEKEKEPEKPTIVETKSHQATKEAANNNPNSTMWIKNPKLVPKTNIHEQL